MGHQHDLHVEQLREALIGRIGELINVSADGVGSHGYPLMDVGTTYIFPLDPSKWRPIRIDHINQVSWEERKRVEVRGPASYREEELAAAK